MAIERFGESQEEVDIKDRIAAREITQTVIEYGVNENQIKQIIYLLALNLENVQLMKEVTSLIKEDRKVKKSNIIIGENNE